MPLGAAKIAYQGYSVAAEETGRTALTLTAVNDAQVDTAQNNFGGASLLLDGTGDYLKAEYPDSSDIDFGTGDFTVEGFVRFNSALSGQNALITGPAQTSSFTLQFNGSTQIRLGRTNTAWDATPTVTAPSTGVWYHFAVVKDSGTLHIYWNGTRIYSASNSNSYKFASYATIGAYISGGSPFYDVDGHFDEIRFSTSARYTASTLTVPTAAFVNDADTVLLIHADGTDGSTTFTDDTGSRAQVGVSAINDAQVDTAQYKFGGASALFDGTGDYLELQLPSQSGDWTVECWVRNDGSWAGQNHCFYADDSVNAQAFIDSNGRLAYYRGGTTTGSTVLSNNTWHHVAVVRTSSDGQVRFYLNGNYEGGRGDSNTHADTVWIGVNSGASGAYWDGWIDEWRFSSIDRYNAGTGNFTAPTSAFTNDADTVLLLHMDGSDASTDFPDDNE